MFLACLPTLSPANPGASCVTLQGLPPYPLTSQYLTKTNLGYIFIPFVGVWKRTAIVRCILWGDWSGIIVQNRLQWSERRLEEQGHSAFCFSAYSQESSFSISHLQSPKLLGVYKILLQEQCHPSIPVCGQSSKKPAD